MAKEVRLNSFKNSWYQPGKGLLIRLVWYFINILFFINPLILSGAIKVTLLRIFGAKVGRGVVIKPNVNIKYPWRLTIGNYCWIGERVWIDNLADVVIGEHVCLSQGAMLLTGNHNYKSTAFDLMLGEIILEKGSWVGAQSMVAPGTIVRSHAVLSAGSIGKGELQPYTIYAGNPAVAVRERKIN